MVNHLIKNYKMGIPTTSTESFELLQQQKVIDARSSEKLRKMVHFHNTVIHQYQRIDLEIVKSVIIFGLDDLIAYGDQVIAFMNED